MIVLGFTLGLAVLLCGLYLLLAHRWQILDTPGHRSSHQRPTPHGGGVPLMLAFAAGYVLYAQYQAWPAGYGTVVALALLLMLLGIADDLLALSVRLRLGLYGLACLAATLLLLPLPLGAHPVFAVALTGLLCVGMLWLLNLYNFMDGIDGIAASQCLLACAAAAALSWQEQAGNHYAMFCLLLAASQLGFLAWNWPPARLFMGDAGSVPTGFVLGCMALLGFAQGQLHPACWLILLAVFITDASWTLVWRLVTGQDVTQAHRLHAYQRLSRRWNSHLQVDLLLFAVFLGWLLPLAWLLDNQPQYALLLVILAYLPLGLGMAKTRPLA